MYRSVMWSVVVGSSLLVTAASAQDCGGFGGGYGWPYLNGISLSPNAMDYIPYFAAHPPVYYSYPVPRPYGYSPYAYPPGTRTPEIEFEELPQSKILRNPFMDEEQEQPVSAPDDEQNVTARRVRKISNPFARVSLR